MIVMGRLLLKNTILNNQKKDILIVDERISRISDFIELTDCEVIDANGMAVLPGFVNMHCHTAMTLMRGVKEDTPLQEWLQEIWKIEARLDEEMMYWGAKLAFLEMIKSGTTTFFDMYWMVPVVQKAAEEMGIRGFFSYVFLDGFDKKKGEASFREFLDQYEASKSWSSLSRFAISVHADYTNSEETIVKASEFAKKHDIHLQFHVSETRKEMEDSYEKFGFSPVKHFENLGVLGPHTSAAHALWLSEDDIRILGDNKVNIVHNVNSNLKISSGYKFKYEELRNAGANVCLGTDGAATNNNLDMLETMKTTALLQKAWRKNPAAMPLNELLQVATLNGAKALGIDSGVVEEGKLADLILIDKRSSAFIPDIDFLGNFVYSANSSCIDTMICNGKILMRGRKVEREDEILEASATMAYKLLKMK